MRNRQYDLTTLTFVGDNFADHGLELDFLPDLVTYKQLVVKTAEELWRAANPGKTRLPKGFSEGICLKFFAIEPGSAAVPVKRVISYDEQEGEPLFDPAGDLVDKAVTLIEEAVESVEGHGTLPPDFPKNVIPLFGEFGRHLPDGHAIQMQTPGRRNPAVYTPDIRNRLVNWVEAYYEDEVVLTGEVRQTDLDGLKFKVRLDDGKKVEGQFQPEQEDLITEALREHSSRRLRIEGSGRFLRTTGQIDRLTRIDVLGVAPPEDAAYDASAKPIWEQIMEIGAAIPTEDQAQLPEDLAVHRDDYLAED